MDNTKLGDGKPAAEVHSTGTSPDIPPARSADNLPPGDIRHNMISLITLDTVWTMGWNDILIALTPLLVFLNATNKMIGLVNGAAMMGLLGVLLSPFITRRFRLKKWYLYSVNVPYMGALLIAGLLAYLNTRIGLSGHQLLLWVFGLVFLSWTFGGFCSLPLNEYMAACIPINRRGRLLGYSFTLGGVGSVLLSLYAERIIRILPKPMCFGVVLLIGTSICLIGYTAALFAREVPTPVEKSPKPWSAEMVKRAWNDKPYVRALVLYCLASMFVGPVFTFINVYGLSPERGVGMALSTAAIMGIVAQVVRLVFSAPIGHFVDKLTPKRVIPYLFLVAAIGYLPVILLRNAVGVYISIALTTVYACGQSPAFYSLLLSLPKPEDRAGHYTFQNLMQYVGMSAGPILAGFMCDKMPFVAVFVIFGIITLLLIPFSKYMLASLADRWGVST